MKKTDVYSWRVAATLKEAIRAEARRERVSVAAVLERITGEWLERRRHDRTREEGEQARRHALAARTFGVLAGGDPQRSAHVRATVRARLASRRAR